jgi:WD40 repeat protein
MALHRMLISAWIFGIGMTAAAQNPEPLPPGAIMQLGTTRFKHPRAIEPAYSITPDGSQFIAFLREEKKLLFWDLQTGRLVRSLKLTVRDSCLGIAWAPDGLSFALMELDSESGALREGRITVRDLGTGIHTVVRM